MVRRLLWFGVVLALVLGFALLRRTTAPRPDERTPMRPSPGESVDATPRLRAPPAGGGPKSRGEARASSVESAQGGAVPARGVLEVSVVEDATERPVPGAAVHVRGLQARAFLTATTDAEGLARL